ncbi:MAG: hypothetical protein E3J72_06690 [Planctomycetota bacterium]|nr:MAG: hypothetical protein E3J72_06690 [Planctomycetota bacterium]
MIASSLKQAIALDQYPEPIAAGIRESVFAIVSHLDTIVKDPEDLESRAQLNRLFWPLASRIAESRVALASGTRLNFSRSEMMLINFGYIDGRIFSGTEADLDEIIDDIAWPPEMPDVEFIYLTEWAEKRYMKLIKVPQMHLLGHELASARQTLRKCTEEFESLCRARAITAGSGAEAKKYLSTVEQIDDILPLYTVIATKLRTASLRPDEYRGYRNMKNVLGKLEDDRDRFIRGRDGSVKLRHIDRKTTFALLKIPKYEMEIDRLDKEIRSLMQRRKEITTDVKQQAVRDEVNLCRRLLRSASGISLEAFPHTYLSSPPAFTKARVAETVRQVLMYDHVLKHMISDGSCDPLRFVFLPGRGNAFYDVSSKAAFVPVLAYSADPVEPLVRAIGHFRLVQTAGLIQSYHELSHISKYRSRFVLRRTFTRDYWHWFDREARGFRKLSRNVRAWFAEHVFRPLNEEEVAQ